MFYLRTHSTHFIYGYMASNIWLRTILIVRKETRCHHIDLTAKVLLYAPFHRQDNTYHCLCYTSHGALAGTCCTESIKGDTVALQLFYFALGFFCVCFILFLFFLVGGGGFVFVVFWQA